jgi:CubicO group peptidase (beta-lactamase class C family)
LDHLVPFFHEKESQMQGKTLLYVFLALMIGMAACAPLKSMAVQVPEPDYWPTEGWQSSTPEAQGMDSAQLANMLEDIASKETNIYSVLVIRNGYLVTEAYFHPYTRDTKMHIQSVTKSVISILVGRAISDGLIKSADEKLVDFYQNRVFENQNQEKDAILLKHLLSMSSGLACSEILSSGPQMEQSSGWVQFVLDSSLANKPGKVFGYCNGNAHLLSAILEKGTGMSTREYANQVLFEPLGIPTVGESDWAGDPQNITNGGWGLHLRPIDMAKLGFLYLNQGQWDGQQIVPAEWVAESITQHIQKDDGNGYGYLWTVYPESDHYAALGLGGQQIHVYPSRNLIVVVTAALEAFAGTPAIDSMLNDYILPSIQSEDTLAENSNSFARLHESIETAANPGQFVPPLPAIALDISGSTYTFEKNNPLGWDHLEFAFREGAPTAHLQLQDFPVLEIGLDNIYRLSTGEAIGELFLRGRWRDEQTFVIDYPYPPYGPPLLGELGETEYRFKFSGDQLEVTVEELIFGGEPLSIKGSR